MKNIMVGANRYVRGGGALGRVGELTRALGKRAFIIGGKTALSKALGPLSASLLHSGIETSVHVFHSEVCAEQAHAFRDMCLSENADFVIGVGGGKVMDISKWTADLCSLPVVTVPTCAATCACMVSLIVTYHEDGQANQGIYAADSPWLCLADTDIIGHAPVRLLVSGIADTLSKWPETHYAMRGAENGVFNFLTSSLSLKVYEELLEVGPRVIETIRRDETHDAADSWDEAVGELVDLIFFMSALVGNTAGDAYRLAIAHGVHDGLIAIKPTVIHNFFHGEKVGYGTLVQLMLLRPEVSPEQIKKVHRAFVHWGLPVSLRDFGLNASEETADALARAVLIPKIQNGPSYTPHEVLKRAILELEALG